MRSIAIVIGACVIANAIHPGFTYHWFHQLSGFQQVILGLMIASVYYSEERGK